MKKSKAHIMTEEQKRFAEQLFCDNYDMLSKRMYRLLRDIDPDSTEDCLGNLFLTLCLSVDKVMNHENPTAWLFLTARYICLKHIRAVGSITKRNIPLEDTFGNISSDTSIEDAVIEDILWEQWENEGVRQRLIADLNENEQIILKLRFEQGLSNSRIGELLGKSEDSIRFTVYYIKKKITARIYSGDF